MKNDIEYQRFVIAIQKKYKDLYNGMNYDELLNYLIKNYAKFYNNNIDIIKKMTSNDLREYCNKYINLSTSKVKYGRINDIKRTRTRKTRIITRTIKNN